MIRGLLVGMVWAAACCFIALDRNDTLPDVIRLLLVLEGHLLNR